MCNTARPCEGSVQPQLTHSHAFSLEFFCNIWVECRGEADDVRQSKPQVVRTARAQSFLIWK